MFDNGFWRDFLSNFLATLFGIVAGLPFALWIDRVVRKRNEKDKLDESKRHAQKILSLLEMELKYNYDEMSKFHINIKSYYYPVRTESWKTFSDGGELQWIEDSDILLQLSNAYSSIYRYESILNVYVNAIYFPPADNLNYQQRSIDPLYQQIRIAKENALNQVKSTIDKLNTKLNELNNVRLIK